MPVGINRDNWTMFPDSNDLIDRDEERQLKAQDYLLTSVRKTRTSQQEGERRHRNRRMLLRQTPKNEKVDVERAEALARFLSAQIRHRAALRFVGPPPNGKTHLTVSMGSPHSVGPAMADFYRLLTNDGAPDELHKLATEFERMIADNLRHIVEVTGQELPQHITTVRRIPVPSVLDGSNALEESDARLNKKKRMTGRRRNKKDKKLLKGSVDGWFAPEVKDYESDDGLEVQSSNGATSYEYSEDIEQQSIQRPPRQPGRTPKKPKQVRVQAPDVRWDMKRGPEQMEGV